MYFGALQTECSSKLSWATIKRGNLTLKKKQPKNINLKKQPERKTPKSKQSSGYLRNKGFSLLSDDDYGKAIPYFQKAIKNNPLDSQAYFGIGICHKSLENYAGAIKAFKKAIKIKPDFSDAYFNLGGDV